MSKAERIYRRRRYQGMERNLDILINENVCSIFTNNVCILIIPKGKKEMTTVNFKADNKEKNLYIIGCEPNRIGNEVKKALKLCYEPAYVWKEGRRILLVQSKHFYANVLKLSNLNYGEIDKSVYLEVISQLTAAGISNINTSTYRSRELGSYVLTKSVIDDDIPFKKTIQKIAKYYSSDEDKSNLEHAYNIILRFMYNPSDSIYY